MLPAGFGFDSKGKLAWRELGWNELEYQREKYGMPESL
jgi:hypothetical protein